MTIVKGFRLPHENVISPRVVITMPAYKAEATLARTVADIPAGIADQLILVDDASPDNTAELARELGIKVHVHAENRGYGGNQKTCYSMALEDDADIVVMLHPDYQYEPRAVPLLIAPILAGDADMTFGSRFAGGFGLCGIASGLKGEPAPGFFAAGFSGTPAGVGQGQGCPGHSSQQVG